MAETTDLDGIALIGMACRFPGARDAEHFWANLRDGVESISSLSDNELEAAGVTASVLRARNYVKAAPLLDEVEMFDASFFGFTPREAEIMDPQHRLFLECAWEALETAGYDSDRCRGRIGVFAGAGLNTYAAYKIYPAQDLRRPSDPIQLMVALDKDFLPTLVSYKMNLRGPSVGIQTACSTGLVAVNLACQSLMTYGCDMALAGSVSVQVPHRSGYFFLEGSILSPDGHCRAFDADGAGTVLGSGAGVVVLKRLEDALADGDTIDAVIRGSAINNDGARKVGYTAPSIQGQAEVIATAMALAGVGPDDIGFVEAHGFGTPLGDPIEFAALREAFATARRRGACALGSVKTNIGHLEAAAGMASLIKAVLALKHRQLPPTLHFRRPNPQIDLAASPFYVNTELRPWTGTPRRAGVSSFGIGGTNAHVILEEAPEPTPADPSRHWHLLLLSARTGAALETASARLADHLERHPELALAEVAYTLQVGRRRFDHRRALVCRDRAEAIAALRGNERRRFAEAYGRTSARPVTLLLPGGVARRPGLGRELYTAEAVFRAEIDRCAELLRPHLGGDLRVLLASSVAAGADIALPSLFALEYALAKLWMSWGIQPESLMGQGVGEYVAACLAGALDLESALALTVALGRMAQRLPEGLSGQAPAPPLLDRFAVEVERVAWQAPRLPIWSSFTGARLDPAEPVHWVRAPWQQGRSGEALRGLLREPERVLLDMGPGGELAELAARYAARPADQIIVRSWPPAGGIEPEPASLLTALGGLWLAGVDVDWKGFHTGARRRRVPLPTYPFERQRFWLDDVAWSTADEAPKSAQPRYRRPDLPNPFLAPRDEMERAIAEIWQEELGFAPVGVEDNFFELGGHSVLAIRIINRLRTTFEIEIPLQGLFAAPTVAGLAEAIVASLSAQGDDLAAALAELEPTG